MRDIDKIEEMCEWNNRCVDTDIKACIGKLMIITKIISFVEIVENLVFSHEFIIPYLELKYYVFSYDFNSFFSACIALCN